MTLPLPQLVRLAAFSLAIALLAACAAPAPSAGAAQSAAGEAPAPVAAADPAAAPASDVAAQEPAPTPMPAPPRHKRTGGPLPPSRIEDAEPGEVKLDTSCRTDADCTVKNVGNCCGEYPACVNTRSPTDPKGVQARCAKSGMAAVCGFPEISGCSCVKGTCQAAGSHDVEETTH